MAQATTLDAHLHTEVSTPPQETWSDGGHTGQLHVDVEEKLPGLICSVGSVRLPSTTNAIERFFRAFQRFYATRGGFHSILSAKRELLLFLVVYVFTQHATTGHAPLEVIVPEARRMPLYRLINDPFRALQERDYVKPEAHMADLLLPQAAGA